MDFNQNLVSGRQISPQFANVNKRQVRNANMATAKPTPTLNQYAFSKNVQKQGGMGMNNYWQQNATTTTTNTGGNIATVTPLTANDDLSKYFAQSRAVQKGPAGLQRNYLQQGNNIIDNYDLSNKNFKEVTTTTTTQTTRNDPFNQPFTGLTTSYSTPNMLNFRTKRQAAKVTSIGNTNDTNLQDYFNLIDNKNLKGTTTTTTTTKALGPLDMKDLPEVFGSSNYNNFKQTTTTTKVVGNVDNLSQPNVFGTSDVQNLKKVTTTTTGGLDNKAPQTKTTITKEEFINMKDLPEVFGSSDIQKVKKITTTTTTETKGDSKDQFKTTITKEEFINMKDLPEVFGSYDIPKYKKVTTTTTETKGKGESKDLSTNNIALGNKAPQTKTTITKEEFINMKDLPEVFGSSDIQKVKKITTTTTTETKGDSKDQFKTTITKEEFINMKDLPEVFGSYDIPKYKKVTTTTTETKGNTDTSGNMPWSNDNLGKTTTTTTTTKTEPFNYGQNMTTTTTTTKKTTTTTDNAPIDLKQFGIEQNTDTNQVTDYSKYFGTQSSEPFDLKQFGLDDKPSIVSNVKKITTTTKTTGNSGDNLYLNNFNVDTTTNNSPIDLKQFGIDDTQNISSSGTGLNDYNFKQTTTTTTTTTGTTGNDQIDLKQFGIDQSKNDSSYGITGFNEYNYKVDNQSSSGGIDLKEFGITGDTYTTPSTGNQDYSQYFKETKTTTTTTTGNSPSDLNQFGLDLNTLSSNTGGLDLKTLGLDNTQQKTTTTTTVTKTGNIGGVDDFSVGGFDYKSFGLDNVGTTQNIGENINTYGSSGTKTTLTKVTKASSYAPAKSSYYQYQYSYNMPTTTSSTVTKTTYS